MAAEHTVPKLASSSSASPLRVALAVTKEPQSITSRHRERSREREGGRESHKEGDNGSDRRRRRDPVQLSETSHTDHRRRHHHRNERPRDELRRKSRRHRDNERHDGSPVGEKRALIKYQSKDSRAEPQQETDALFFVDKRGDSLISKYGTIDRSKVPSYHRYGAGKLLGAQGRFTINRDGPNDEFTIGTPRDRGSVFREKHTALLKAGRSKGRRIKGTLNARGSLQDEDKDQDFISLGRSRDKKKNPDEGSSASDDEEPSYRSIHGRAKNHEFSDSDLDYDSDDPTAIIQDDDLRKLRSIELARQVKDKPNDIGAWLGLVALQDYLIGKEFGTQERTIDEKQSLADIKLSMLEKALAHSGSQGDREKVLLRMMHVGSQKWEPGELVKRWQDISEDYAESFDLWRARMDFEMINLSTFTFERIKLLYIKRVAWLQQQVESASDQPEADVIGLCAQLIYVFLRMTRFLQDSGYSELAVAAWQAVLELTFSRPPDLTEVVSHVVKANFADFWESEVARIGEPRAKGWKDFASVTEDLDVPESKATEVKEPTRTRDAYKAWATAEQQQKQISTLPARTLDDGADEDPFRVVMFSDIEDLVFVLPLPTLSQVQLLLLDCFLLFCQVAPYSREDSWIQLARRDSFIGAGASDLMLCSDTSSTNEQGTERKLPAFSHPSGHFAIGPDTSFSTQHWFRSHPSPHQSLQRDHPTMTSLATLSIRHLVRNHGIKDLASFSLMLEHAQDPMVVKKAGKALLKLYPSDISLYNAYALAEHANGNFDTAEKVLGAATSPDVAFHSEDSMLLWNTWSWMELDRGHNNLAVHRLCASLTTQGDGVAPSQLLKARQHLASTRDYQLSTGNRDIAAVFAQSYVLLEYLTGGHTGASSVNRQGSLAPALDAVFLFSEELTSRGHGKSLAHELFLQFAARLIYFHTSLGPYRPTYVREQLLRFIKLFPENTIFLHLFAWAESSLRLNDPVREVLRSTVLIEPHDTLSARIFAIQHELRIGNVYSIRAAFESALASPACKGSAGLWRAYVRFCHERKELKAKAKDVFYRALKECPWSKDLVMEAFGVLVGEMDSGELKAVFGTMQAKGLRVHVDLEEFVVKWKEEQKTGSRKR